jgi:hypothetical protein
MPEVTLIRGRSYFVLGKIFHIGVPQEVRDEDAAKLEGNPSFRTTEPVAPVAPDKSEELSRDELKSALDAAEIEYNSRSRTETLQELYDENCV